MYTELVPDTLSYISFTSKFIWNYMLFFFFSFVRFIWNHLQICFLHLEHPIDEQLSNSKTINIRDDSLS